MMKREKKELFKATAPFFVEIIIKEVMEVIKAVENFLQAVLQ